MTENEAHVVAKHENHIQPISNGTPSPLRTLCSEVHEKVFTFLEKKAETDLLWKVQARCHHTITIISIALDRYPLETLSLSYNGGKDCLVLLILYLACLDGHPNLPTSLSSILIPPPHPFPAVDTFVEATSAQYHLSLSRYSSPSMKDAFREYLDDTGKNIKAIFVGTRRTDPHGGKLGPFDKTDRGWPEFMRVHPVLDWRYAEVWAFLRHLEIPYCELYDQGYTSLGGTNDTHPNPALRVEEGGVVSYRPAYELVEDADERLGRDW